MALVAGPLFLGSDFVRLECLDLVPPTRRADARLAPKESPEKFGAFHASIGSMMQMHQPIAATTYDQQSGNTPQQNHGHLFLLSLPPSRKIRATPIFCSGTLHRQMGLKSYRSASFWHGLRRRQQRASVAVDKAAARAGKTRRVDGIARRRQSRPPTRVENNPMPSMPEPSNATSRTSVGERPN
ncbi:MAG TPA: hypothetical protein VFL62_13140 [Bradyrhizobium sp.]|uniref:hypothetical protein n=1 Tax=Bradyrhizobium sp. TaxID=376 RepID=UPI002D7F0339|nr:hypothetical protein [Bradyrhizobium sp.]HET7887166.1 hypothetical protein [Bradyrhizobium sp.]